MNGLKDVAAKAWVRWREPGQLALFELAHEHVFERWVGPHLVFPPLATVMQANPDVCRYFEYTDRWCISCCEYVKFVDGVEVPRRDEK